MIINNTHNSKYKHTADIYRSKAPNLFIAFTTQKDTRELGQCLYNDCLTFSKCFYYADHWIQDIDYINNNAYLSLPRFSLLAEQLLGSYSQPRQFSGSYKDTRQILGPLGSYQQLLYSPNIYIYAYIYIPTKLIHLPQSCLWSSPQECCPQSVQPNPAFGLCWLNLGCPAPAQTPKMTKAS